MLGCVPSLACLSCRNAQNLRAKRRNVAIICHRDLSLCGVFACRVWKLGKAARVVFGPSRSFFSLSAAVLLQCLGRWFLSLVGL